MTNHQKPSTEYEKVADKVGLVPNVRTKDNLYQGVAVLGTTTLGLTGGLVSGGWPVGALVGALAGLVIGGLVSGGVLMVLGLMRR